jgi:hypothetical protein
MKNAKMFLFSAFLFFVAMSAFASADQVPIFVGNTSSNTSYQFSHLQNYGFQVTITNGTDAGNITNVTFQLGRPVGTLTNYTNYSAILVKNNTNSIWHINFTQEQLGPAGTYNYTWFANTTIGSVWNNTQTIGKIIAVNTTNQVTLWFMNTTDNVANANMTAPFYRYPNTVNITAYNIFDRSGTISIYWKNTTLFTSANNTNITLNVGVNNIVANTSGNANFSANARNFFINITQGRSIMTITANGTYSTQDNVIVTGTESNIGDNDVSYSLFLDNVIISTSLAPVSISDTRNQLNSGTRIYGFNSSNGENWSVNITGVLSYMTISAPTGGLASSPSGPSSPFVPAAQDNNVPYQFSVAGGTTPSGNWMSDPLGAIGSAVGNFFGGIVSAIQAMFGWR